MLRRAGSEFCARLVGKKTRNGRVEFRRFEPHHEPVKIGRSELVRTAQPFEHAAPLPRRTDIDAHEPVGATEDRVLNALDRSIRGQEPRGLTHRRAAIYAIPWI